MDRLSLLGLALLLSACDGPGPSQTVLAPTAPVGAIRAAARTVTRS